MPRNLSRLDSLLLHLVKKFMERTGREITITRLVKLLYLSDLEFRRRGMPGLGVRWVRWYYGPFSNEIVREVEFLVERGYLKEEYVPTSSGVIRVFRTKRGLSFEVDPNVAAVLDEVIEKFGFMKFDKLLEEVYSTFDPEGVDLGEEISVESPGR